MNKLLITAAAALAVITVTPVAQAAITFALPIPWSR